MMIYDAEDGTHYSCRVFRVYYCMKIPGCNYFIIANCKAICILCTDQ